MNVPAWCVIQNRQDAITRLEATTAPVEAGLEQIILQHVQVIMNNVKPQQKR